MQLERVEGFFIWMLQLKDECDANQLTSGTGRVIFALATKFHTVPFMMHSSSAIPFRNLSDYGPCTVSAQGVDEQLRRTPLQQFDAT